MKKSLSRLIIMVSFICFSSHQTVAQPYIDLMNVRYVKSPDAGFFRHNKNATELNYLNISTTLPIQFNHKKDAVVLSPYFEQWSSEVENVDSFHRYHYGLVLPVSLLKSIPHSNWSLLITPIIRMNDMKIDKNGKWQFGGALIASYKKAENKLVYKIGVYVNGDLFGLFVMPLLGIDWSISERSNLFGLLPGSLTFENKINPHFYWGATFRAITNSYVDTGMRYLRIDENQLGIFADYYLTKNIVLTAEAGHSLFRKIRTGIKNETKTDWQANDNVYLKLSLAYRIRLR